MYEFNINLRLNRFDFSPAEYMTSAYRIYSPLEANWSMSAYDYCSITHNRSVKNHVNILSLLQHNSHFIFSGWLILLGLEEKLLKYCIHRRLFRRWTGWAIPTANWLVTCTDAILTYANHVSWPRSKSSSKVRLLFINTSPLFTEISYNRTGQAQRRQMSGLTILFLIWSRVLTGWKRTEKFS